MKVTVSSAITLLIGSFIVSLPADTDAKSCEYWGAQPTVGSDVSIEDVAAAGPCAAWAVGSFDDAGTKHTLILRWNGTNWAVQPSPNRGTGNNFLRGVTAISATNAWAVGSGADDRTLILHWNGTAWKKVKSPNVAVSFNDLFDVDATSANNAWAVGERDDNGGYRALILHWNGTAWKLQKTPDVAGTEDELFGVAGASGKDGWAVGCASGESLILHWNGIRWRRTASPSPGTGACFTGAEALSKGPAWAAGSFGSASGDAPLLVRWNGSAWKRQKTPTSDYGARLQDVAGASKTNAWAVGIAYTAYGASTMVLHWDGTAWKRRPSWNPDGTVFFDNRLTGVTKIPGSSGAWAVGDYDGPPRSPAILHCC